MAERHRARQIAVQVLFQLELQPGDWREPLRYHLEQQPLTPADRSFLEALLQGAADHHQEIDVAIASGSSHWTLDQMGAVERAVLRLAVEELDLGDAPRAVVISEGVALAKLMAGDEAAKFVNGVLGNLGRRQGGVRSGAGTPGR
ncbi:MAG: transcription antitermination factor NusB [Candidatus Dormibacteria bacterium]